mgnify:CR=1 FL=1
MRHAAPLAVALGLAACGGVKIKPEPAIPPAIIEPIATEVGLVYRLHKDNPDKKFYPASELAVCPNMKRTNLEKILWALEEMKNEVRVSDEIRKKAKKSIDAMMSIG